MPLLAGYEFFARRVYHGEGLFIWRRGMKKTDKAPKEDVKAIQIRFPVPLYEELKRRSKENRRSFNAEVVVILVSILASGGAT
jgi:hypothetical protein